MKRQLTLSMLLSVATSGISAVQPHCFFEVFDSLERNFFNDNMLPGKHYQPIREESDTEKITSYKKHDDHIAFIIKNVDSKDEIAVDYNGERLQINIDNLSHTLLTQKKVLVIITEESVKKESKDIDDKEKGHTLYSSYRQHQQSIPLNHFLNLEKAQVKYNKKERTATLSIPYKATKKIMVCVEEE